LEAGVLEKGMEVKVGIPCPLVLLFNFWIPQCNNTSVIVQVCTSEDSCRYARVSELYVYEKFFRVPADRVEAGDICAVCGISDVQVKVYGFRWSVLSCL
jgi:translation elongation factor EF-G